MDSPTPCVDYGVLRLSQKNGCGVLLQDATAYLIFQEEICMKNKKMVLILGAFVARIAAMAGVFAMTRPETTAGGKEITVAVVHADGTEKTFEYATDEEFLGPVILAEGLVEGVEGPYGLEISAVDGEAASWEENQSYWALFIGEEYATTGAYGIVLTDGGEYKLVYTIG